jgi:putative ATP-binding cassette transporter
MEQIIQARHYSAWALIKTYWQSSERTSAYLFTISILALTVLLVGFDVVFTYWYNYFYNALQEYNVHDCVRLLILFFILAAFYIVLQVYRYYIAQLFGLRWRRWLTDQLIGRWLHKRGYYYLENFDEKTDNPDQRIQEDAGALVTSSIDLTVGLVSAITTFPAFVYILWTLSGVMTFSLGPLGTFKIYGYLVWVGVLYNLIGTLIAFKIGRPLVILNFEQQRKEANFRFAAIDLRSHAEDVALYRGERHQKNILNTLFRGVLDNWYAIILRQKKLLWFTGSYNQTAVVLPLLVALPNYFNKVFQLGGLMQTIKAFSSVQDSLSFLVNAYTQIALWRAIAQRLTTFLNHLDDVENKAKQADKIKTQIHNINTIQTKDLTINTPRGHLLLKDINEELKHGQNYLIKGESGIGKSTFVRTLAGIWPYAEGEVTFPAKQHIMFLPQKPYMPIGTLAEAILFPDKHQPELEKEIESVLRACHLEGLSSRLNEVAPWSEQLSPGEQQRVAFARVLLHKPNWVFLDESTSMLDVANEKYLYQLLHDKLPHCSIVSIGHRPTLEAMHDHIIDVTKYSTLEPA